MSEFRIKPDTAPGTPPPGLLSIYSKTDKKLYIKDDAGAEWLVGPGDGITELTGDVTAGPGYGSQVAAVAFVGGASAVNIATVVSNTTGTNTGDNTFTAPLINTAGNVAFNGAIETNKFWLKDPIDITKLLKWDLSSNAASTTLTILPQITSNMNLRIPQIVTPAGTGMALVQDETTGYIFSSGITAPIGGGNSMLQLANATVGNRAQIKLHSYFNGPSVAGVSTLTSRSGIIGVNTSLVLGQDYSKWTAQAAGATPGSAPISGTFAFKVAGFDQIGPNPFVLSDFHIQLTNAVNNLSDRLYLTCEGVLQLPFYSAGFAQFDSSGNISSVPNSVVLPTRTVTAISYAALITDKLIAVTNTVAPRTITLPLAATAGLQFLTIKDESGGAAVNGITVSPSGADTIDGVTSLIITANYGRVQLYSNGISQWFTL